MRLHSVDKAAYLDAIRIDVDRAGMALACGPLTAGVAACPGWSLSDLVWHLGGVHHFWTAIVDGRLQSPDQVVRAERPPDAELPSWFATTAGRLSEVLSGADMGERVWTWSSQHDVAFVCRRMAQETAVHRWDAEAAVGTPSGITRELASDGIGEFVDVMVPDGPPVLDDITLTELDRGATWKVGQRDGRSATVSGPASDLLLALWRRLPIDAVTISGDVDAAMAFLQRTDLD